MRDWKLVLYNYAYISVLESEYPDSSARTGRCLSQCGFDTAGPLQLLHFFLFLYNFFFSVFNAPRFYSSF